MEKYSVLSIILLASRLGAALAFGSGLGGPRHVLRQATRPSSINHGLDSSLFASPLDTDGAAPVDVQKRRAFLAKLAAATSLIPLLPSSASARGFGANENGPIVYGGDDIMSQKGHGTTGAAVQSDLRYSVSNKLADKICSFNRMFAEMGGYWEGTTFEKEVRNAVASSGGPVTFYDSVSGKPLFKAPVGRSVDEFIAESKVHGWPSFRVSVAL